MASKINHMAIVSQQYTLLAAYYQAVFKMKRSEKDRPMRAITVGDGYVGLNINPRKAGDTFTRPHCVGMVGGVNIHL
jgi:hypothetical protein